MKSRVLLLLLVAIAGLAACGKKTSVAAFDPLRNAYDSEPDWNDPQRVIPLGYEQAQGKRIFYQQCVWCHADSTSAGPSNRSNVTPTPPLFNDGSVLNGESDEFLQNIITLGGSAMGKSAMMPPYGKTLTQEEIHSLIAYARAIAVPAYQPSVRPAAKSSEK
jgi:mono/diheme cytochrome c family protein